MRYGVFYSWLSDLPNKTNRSFIETALERAAAAIAKDDTFSIEPVVDRNADGIPGSPSIISSIMDKISRSDMFVCDVSIINYGNAERSTPNPNVIMELGYASAKLGWDRIIMVQNLAFGGPELLPFDIRGRRIVSYFLNEESSNKPEIRKKLEDDLLKIFQKAFEHHRDAGQYKHNETTWWGYWRLQTRRKANEGALRIHQVSSTDFYFRMTLLDGARSGEIKGNAKIVSPHAAVATLRTYDDKTCVVIFRRMMHNDYWIIDVEESRECDCYSGMGASFNGTYALESESLLYYGHLNESEMNLIASVTGEFCGEFLERFQQIGEVDSQDNAMSKVVAGGIKGMYTLMQGIVGLSDSGQIWCAYIDGDIVRYFTTETEWRRTLPKTFEKWREAFAQKQVIYPDMEEMKTSPVNGYQESLSMRFGAMKELFLKPDKKRWQFWKK